MKSLRFPGLLSVVSKVTALVVEFPVNPDPVGLVDPSPVPAVGTLRKGAGDLDPPSLFPCDGSNLFGDLREILILAHDQCHVVFATMSKSNHIKRDPYVDPLLLPCQKRVLCAVGLTLRAFPVSKRPAIYDDPLSSHHRELASPEGVPSAILVDIRIRNSSVKAYLDQLPSLVCTNLLGEG